MEELSILRFSVLRVTLDTSTSAERVGTGLAPLKHQEEKTTLTSFYCNEFDNMTWVNNQHNRFPQQHKCCNHGFFIVLLKRTKNAGNTCICLIPQTAL